jgi:hypothetical protein
MKMDIEILTKKIIETQIVGKLTVKKKHIYLIIKKDCFL